MVLWLCKYIFFQTSIEYIFYPFIGIKTDIYGFFTSLVQPIGSMLFHEVQDTHTGFESLFRVFSALENYFDDLFDIIPYRSSPSNKTIRIPFGVISVIRGHMRMQCCVVVWGVVSTVLSYSYVVVIYRHIPVIIDDPNTFSFQLPRDAVIMPVLPQFNMVIELYC